MSEVNDSVQSVINSNYLEDFNKVWEFRYFLVGNYGCDSGGWGCWIRRNDFEFGGVGRVEVRI